MAREERFAAGHLGQIRRTRLILNQVIHRCEQERILPHDLSVLELPTDQYQVRINHGPVITFKTPKIKPS